MSSLNVLLEHQSHLFSAGSVRFSASEEHSLSLSRLLLASLSVFLPNTVRYAGPCRVSCVTLSVRVRLVANPLQLGYLADFVFVQS